jgi:transcriptional repressor NrdR
MEDKVVDSRSARDGAAVRRRRECLECGKRFTTYESVVETPILVVKKDDRREHFSRDKIMAGLLRACEKRAVPMELLESIIDEIETKASTKPGGEIASRTIGEFVMEGLKEIDQVAYVRFASVYRHFTDVSEFHRELQELIDGSTRNPGDLEERIDEGRTEDD